MNYRKFTQENITELKENEIFVFGSNLNGNHAGGAARIAVDKFGAIQGQATGLQGQSYAIPTLSKDMKKLSLEEIEKYVLDFFKFAEENPHLDFYVTKIGCGIAGFTIKEMQSIFYKIDLTYVFNVALPTEFCKLKGYKGYDKGMQCRGMQFKEEESYHQKGDIKCCNNGIHFCENPLDVFKYYRYENGEVYTIVESNWYMDSKHIDSKIATSDIRIKTKIEFSNLLKIGIDFTFKKLNYLFHKRDMIISKNQKDYNTLAGQDCNTIAGHNDNTLAGQDCNTIAGQDNNTIAGQDCNTLAGQNYNTLIMSGTSNAAISGNGSEFKGKKGNLICLYNRANGVIVDYNVAIIDGEIIKEDVFYKLENGEFVETLK